MKNFRKFPENIRNFQKSLTNGWKRGTRHTALMKKEKEIISMYLFTVFRVVYAQTSIFLCSFAISDLFREECPTVGDLCIYLLRGARATA